MKQQDSFETLCSRLGVKFVCRYCQSESIVKSGKNCNDRHRYQCKHCHKRFITEYIYNAYLPDTDSKITQLTKEGLGNHSTILTLGIMIYQHSFLFTLKGFSRGLFSCLPDISLLFLIPCSDALDHLLFVLLFHCSSC